MTSLSATTAWIASIRDLLGEQLIVPGDVRYDDARTVFPGGIDRRPAAIARPTTAHQVAHVVRTAREAEVELAVRSGGHSGAGHGVVDGGLVLDLSATKGLDLDVENRTAWAGSGLTTGEYTTAVGEHGLVTGFGDTGSVGVGGITLGGGVGFLARAHGLTIDHLLAAEVVTADGDILHVDDTSHPDLYWALRGGGGNFGVATRFRFRLHPLESVVGGMLMLPATADVVADFVAEAEAAPDELTVIANVMTAPPLPFLPPEHHGSVVLMALVCYAGPAEAGERVMAPLRALAAPLIDMVRPVRYAELFPPAEPGYHPRSAAHTMFLERVDRAAAEAIVDRLGASTATMSVVQLRVLGGAVARVPVEATAFAHRRSRIMANVAAVYEQPAEGAVHQAWVDDLASALRQDDTGAYVNFMADEGEQRVRAAYPGRTWDRLQAVKDRYDPTNLFRRNQNVPPSNR